MSEHTNGPVAFVLSGGASHGAIEVGMLYALYERGIVPDLIVATSAGAFNGAFIASRQPTLDTVAALAEVWRSLRQRDVFPIDNLLSGFLGFFGFIERRSHLVSDRGLRALMDRWLEFATLEEAPVPLHVIATDLATGQERRLSAGPVVDAVMASGAIPGVLPPVNWDGRYLVDGGVANNTPISHAIELGAWEVYVLPTDYSCPLTRARHGALAVATQALILLLRQRLAADIQRVPADVRLVVMPPPCPLDVSPTDFSQARELIERARRDGREFLEQLEQDSRSSVLFPPPLRLLASHRH
jgi:NTE family protein